MKQLLASAVAQLKSAEAKLIILLAIVVVGVLWSSVTKVVELYYKDIKLQNEVLVKKNDSLVNLVFRSELDKRDMEAKLREFRQAQDTVNKQLIEIIKNLQK